LAMLFNYSSELIKGFLDRGGLDAFLGLFRLPILPLTYSNEFHSVVACFKSVPANLAHLVLTKVLETLNQQLVRLEDIIGPLRSTADFSHIQEDVKTQFLHILTATDSYIEMTRLVLQTSTNVVSSAAEICSTLLNLGQYMRLLISEQARLSSFSKENEKT